MLVQGYESSSTSEIKRMNPRRLFLQRMVSGWRFQWKAWSLIIDWVIALYIIVPFGVAAVWGYINLWRSPPDWFALIPQETLGLLAFILAWSGQLRWFVVEGDMLFLLQRKIWLATLRRLGIGYSLIINMLASSLVIIVIAPLVLNFYEWTYWQWIGFGLVIMALRMSVQAVIQLGGHFSLWRKIGWYAGLALIALITTSMLVWWLINHLLIFNIGLIGLIGITIFLLKIRYRARGTFMYEVELERKIKLRVAAAVVSNVVKKKPLFRLKRPILFPKSMRFFRKRRTLSHVLAENALKSLLRSFTKWRQYAQITMIGMIAIAISPFTIRWIVWGCLGALMAYWTSWHWKEFMHANFLSLFQIEERQKLAAAELYVGLAILPSWILLSLEVALLGLPSLYGFLALPIGAFIAYLIAKIQWLL